MALNDRQLLQISKTEYAKLVRTEIRNSLKIVKETELTEISSRVATLACHIEIMGSDFDLIEDD